MARGRKCDGALIAEHRYPCPPSAALLLAAASEAAAPHGRNQGGTRLWLSKNRPSQGAVNLGMTLKTPDPARRLRAAALPLLLAACALLAAPSLAASAVAPENVGFGTLMKGASDANEPPVAHYRSDTGPGFVFDKTAPKPLLRFDNSVEMWVLTYKLGPRGDIVYYNDVGVQMLRLPLIGGMTVYPPHNSKGIAASFDQPARPLGLSYILNQAAFDLPTISDTATLTRILPNFEKLYVGMGDVPDGKAPAWFGLAVDTSRVVAETISRLSQDSANRKALAKLVNVRITYAAASSARVSKDELLIDISPLQGLAGRPSSAKIEAALGLH
ncbi:MAG: hypothetical protein JWM33_3111 [Caulobacteraceae bacterium]|nr:hypothetical protein [Caulobacteraceae bacterium]